MKTMTVAQAKNGFDQLVEYAQREPVLVRGRGGPVGVFLPVQVFEDMVLGERAFRAHEEGYLGPEGSGSLLSDLISD
jgi:PHD/YefM family antitoxin component YafN of YafNO toxin-antitoxin module